MRARTLLVAAAAAAAAATLATATAATAAEVTASDSKGNAPVVAGLGPHTIHYATTGAGIDAFEPRYVGDAYVGQTVWARWKAQHTGGVWLRSCGAAAGLGDGFAVVIGPNDSTTGNMKVVAPRATSCGGRELNFHAEAGTSYWIVVDHAKDMPPSGGGTLTLQQGAFSAPIALLPSVPAVTDPRPLFTVTTNANVAKPVTFECQVDDVARGCKDLDAAPLAGGLHTIRARAVDAYLNAGEWTPPKAFTVDATPPETTLTPDLQFWSSEPGGTFRCSLDGGVPKLCTSPYVPKQPLGLGAHTLTVIAYDAVGNADPTAAKLSWTVTPPAPPAAPAPPVAAPPAQAPAGPSAVAPAAAPTRGTTATPASTRAAKKPRKAAKKRCAARSTRAAAKKRKPRGCKQRKVRRSARAAR